MQISLIENGLDSLTKGFNYLEGYERLLQEENDQKTRFLLLKDSILSVQHGIEILFKYILRKHNELFLYKDIKDLAAAYAARREGKITELWEQPKVQTISFKESIDRLQDMCGISITDKLKKTLLQVEGWRNSITHSAVILEERQVSSVLTKLIEALDTFFADTMGDEYTQAQGKSGLEEAYRVARSVNGGLRNSVKVKAIEGLISALRLHSIKVDGAPSVIKVEDPAVAYSILKSIQDNEICYGCDLINGHCSGKAAISGINAKNVISIYTEDNLTLYRFKVKSLVIYIPKLDDDFSPLIYIYSAHSDPEGTHPYLDEGDGYKIQRGLIENRGKKELWEQRDIVKSYEEWDITHTTSTEAIVSFLSEGPVCFMNIQGLEYGNASSILHSNNAATPEKLYESFLDVVDHIANL